MDERTCSVDECTNPVRPRAGGVGRLPRYCLQHPRGRTAQARKPVRLPRRVPPRTIECAQCGATFQSPRKTARFCSKDCGRKYQRANPTAFCSRDGCTQPLRARGVCISHYHEMMGRTYRKVMVPCENCGNECEKYAGATKYAQRFCSMACRDASRTRRNAEIDQRLWHGRPPADDLAQLRVLRDSHASLLLAALPNLAAMRAQAVAEAMTPRPCDDCGKTYTPGTTVQLYYGRRCARRVGRRARRAAVHRAFGSFKWTEVMHLFLKFDRCCAYCDQPVEGQPDPDHVIPLSRGGANTVANLLPSCRSCNTDKRDLSLSEWVVSRASRGLPPVRTEWSADDHRYWHLTSVLSRAA